MCFVDFWRLPRSILPSNSQLRLMVQLDPRGSTEYLALLLECVAGPSFGQKSRWEEFDRLPDLYNRLLLDARPGAVSPGAWAPCLQLGDGEQHDLETNLLVLEENDWQRYVHDAASELFAPSRGLIAREARDFIRNVIMEQIEDDRFDLDGLRRGILFDIRVEPSDSDLRWPATALRWATGLLVEAFRYTAAHGIEALEWRGRLDPTLFELSVRAPLFRVANELAVETAYGFALRDLESWVSAARAAGKELSFELHADPNAKVFAAGVRLELSGIPVAADSAA